jgi:hypothetical protein
MTTKELDNAKRAADIRKDRKGTDRPWERPGQTSQDPSLEPPKKREPDPDKTNKTS